MKKILALLCGLGSNKQHQSNDVPSTVNLEFSDKVKESFRDLMDKTKNSDIIQIIRISLALYHMSVDHVINGGKIIFRKQDGSEETFNPLTTQIESGS